MARFGREIEAAQKLARAMPGFLLKRLASGLNGLIPAAP